MVKHLLTESQTLRAARLQYESSDSDQGHKTARNDEVYDIVERHATKMKRESDRREVHRWIDLRSFCGIDPC